MPELWDYIFKKDIYFGAKGSVNDNSNNVSFSSKKNLFLFSSTKIHILYSEMFYDNRVFLISFINQTILGLCYRNYNRHEYRSDCLVLKYTDTAHHVCLTVLYTFLSMNKNARIRRLITCLISKSTDNIFNEKGIFYGTNYDN